jgi:hypothetical protein
MDAYEQAARQFVSNPATIRVRGTYRGEPAILNYDPATRLVVVQSPSGDFVSGWRMSSAQLQNVEQQRSLGGG